MELASWIMIVTVVSSVTFVAGWVLRLEYEEKWSPEAQKNLKFLKAQSLWHSMNMTEKEGKTFSFAITIAKAVALIEKEIGESETALDSDQTQRKLWLSNLKLAQSDLKKALLDAKKLLAICDENMQFIVVHGESEWSEPNLFKQLKSVIVQAEAVMVRVNAELGIVKEEENE